jgi:hypothetical protein
MVMGETDYKDPDWTEKDLQELHEAGEAVGGVVAGGAGTCQDDYR